MLAIVRKDALSDEKARLEQLLSRMEARVATAFRTFVERATSLEVVKAVIDLVSRGRTAEALAIIDQHVRTLAGSITSVFQDSATEEAVALLQQVIDAGEPPVSISFDPTNPRAAAIMREERLTFIREFGDEQREVTRQVLTQGVHDGVGPRQMAADFKGSIGLTARQRAAVENYGRLLRMGSAQALDRQLRDKRFDRSVQRAVETGEPLGADQIDRMVERYRQKFIAYRAENIARTEAGRALSLGRDETMQQQIDAGIVNANLVDQHWNTITDGRERPSHHDMDGQIQPWGWPFISGAGNRLRFPHDPEAPAEEVIGCRCNKTFIIRRTPRVPG